MDMAASSVTFPLGPNPLKRRRFLSDIVLSASH
jgi:hypothetical protein